MKFLKMRGPRKNFATDQTEIIWQWHYIDPAHVQAVLDHDVYDPSDPHCDILVAGKLFQLSMKPEEAWLMVDQ